MSYQRAKGRGKANFVMLRYDIMDSDAYRSLKPPARCVLHEIARRYNGYNNGKIPLSCREAGILANISKDTASKAFAALMEVGFIKEHEDNYFEIVNRRSRRWILTYEPYDKKASSNEWRKFKPQYSCE